MTFNIWFHLVSLNNLSDIRIHLTHRLHCARTSGGLEFISFRAALVVCECVYSDRIVWSMKIRSEMLPPNCITVVSVQMIQSFFGVIFRSRALTSSWWNVNGSCWALYWHLIGQEELLRYERYSNRRVVSLTSAMNLLTSARWSVISVKTDPR